MISTVSLVSDWHLRHASMTWTRQIAHVSHSTSQLHIATAFHFFSVNILSCFPTTHGQISKNTLYIFKLLLAQIVTYVTYFSVITQSPIIAGSKENSQKIDEINKMLQSGWACSYPNLVSLSAWEWSNKRSIIGRSHSF